MTMLQNALYYYNQGFSIIPIPPQCKSPAGEKDKNGKVIIPGYPIKWTEFQTKRPTEQEINEWWIQWPEASIGIVCGKISGITVLDTEKLANLKIHCFIIRTKQSRNF